jgi:tRNA threonylcarbamoyladenosine biosynthesis protein TsaB
VATARGLAESTGATAVGVCTLDALARGLGRLADGRGGDRLAVLDARRGEAFAARYSAAGERRWGPWVGTPGELRERLSGVQGGGMACGSGALRFRDEIEECGVEVPDDDSVHRVSARDVCALAAAGDAEKSGDPLTPIYLRPPDAERWRERDSSKKAG